MSPSVSFSPDDIAGLELWLDANQITGKNDGDTISTWSDVSGNSNNVTQATAGRQPTYKTNIFNGKPIIRFDDAAWPNNDNLFSTATHTLPSGNGNYSAFIVFSQAMQVVSWNYAFIWGGRSTKTGVHILSPSGNGGEQGVAWIGYYGAGSAVFTGLNDGNPHVISLIYNGTNHTPYKDSVVGTANNNNNGNVATTGIGVGCNGTEDEVFAGDIAEIIVYDTALSDANRGDVETYLIDKYGIV